MSTENSSPNKEVIIDQAIALNVKGGCNPSPSIQNICQYDYCSCEAGIAMCSVNICTALVGGCVRF